MDAKETTDLIINGKSLIRFGDGEFRIYRGFDIHYQPWSEQLKIEFNKIKADYEEKDRDCPYILAVPKKYMQCSGFELGRKRVLVSSWAESRLQFKRTFGQQLTYGDSFLFEKRNNSIFSKIWCNADDTRTVFFVHNSLKCAHNFANTYHRKVIHIQCPSYDAFNSWENIYANILKEINDRQFCPDDVQIVLSAGPAGKVLCYYLSREGYHCIDTGHCWDDPLES